MVADVDLQAFPGLDLFRLMVTHPTIKGGVPPALIDRYYMSPPPWTHGSSSGGGDSRLLLLLLPLQPPDDALKAEQRLPQDHHY